MTNVIDGDMAQAIENSIGNVTQIGFKRLTVDAVIPTRAYATDSGFDLVASEDVIIEPGETAVVPTGIAVELPEGFEAMVRPRSGVTSKTKLRVQTGTIDNGYRGDIGIIVDNIADVGYLFAEIHGGEDIEVTTFPQNNYEYIADDHFLDVSDNLVSALEHFGSWNNFPKGTYLIRKGDRIAQLVIQRLPEVEAIEVFDVGESERGNKGYGSSGINSEEVVK